MECINQLRFLRHAVGYGAKSSLMKQRRREDLQTAYDLQVEIIVSLRTCRGLLVLYSDAVSQAPQGTDQVNPSNS